MRYFPAIDEIPITGSHDSWPTPKIHLWLRSTYRIKQKGAIKRIVFHEYLVLLSELEISIGRTTTHQGKASVKSANTELLTRTWPRNMQMVQKILDSASRKEIGSRRVYYITNITFITVANPKPPYGIQYWTKWYHSGGLPDVAYILHIYTYR